MTTSQHTDEIVENLIDSMLGNADSRQRHLFRENLRNLVRVTRAEQVAEIRENVLHLAGVANEKDGLQQASSARMEQRFVRIFDQAQKKTEFWH